MEPEERNRVMDKFIADCVKPGMSEDVTAEECEVIRECDKRARAWDELEKWVGRDAWIGTFSGEYIQNKIQKTMSQLLSRTPKDPLEELEQTVMELPVIMNSGVWVHRDSLLTEISRIRGKNGIVEEK